MTHSPTLNGKEFPGGIRYLTHAHSPFNLIEGSVINADATDGDVIIYLPLVKHHPQEVFAITKVNDENQVKVIQLVNNTLMGPSSQNSFSPVLVNKGDFVIVKSDGKSNWAVVASFVSNPLDAEDPPLGPPLSQPRVNQAGTAIEYFYPSIINPSGLVRVNTFDATTANFAVDLNQHGLIIVDATANNVQINLPAAATNRGKGVFVQRSDASMNTATVKASGAELINGSNTLSLQQFDDFLIVCTGTGWRIL